MSVRAGIVSVDLIIFEAPMAALASSPGLPSEASSGGRRGPRRSWQGSSASREVAPVAPLGASLPVGAACSSCPGRVGKGLLSLASACPSAPACAHPPPPSRPGGVHRCPNFYRRVCRRRRAAGLPGHAERGTATCPERPSTAMHRTGPGGDRPAQSQPPPACRRGPSATKVQAEPGRA